MSLRSTAVVVVTLVALNACGASGGGTNGEETAGVTYRISTNDPLTIDSVLYDDGHGTLVKVPGPAVNWSVTRSFALPGSIEAHLYATAIGPASAKIHVSWTTTGGDNADSTSNSVSGPGKLHVDFPHRAI